MKICPALPERVVRPSFFGLILLISACIATGEQEFTEADMKISRELGDRSHTFRLWPDSPPDETGENRGTESIEAPSEDDRGKRLTNVTEPSITIRRPADAEEDTPAVLVSPGGAYHSLAIEEEGIEIVEWLNSLGVTGVLLKYRVPRPSNDFPKHHHALQDAQRAMGIIRKNADELGIDANRVGVLGFSAGGHLSAAVSNNYEERLYVPVDEADEECCRPDFAVLIYPAYLVADAAQTDLVAEELNPDHPPPTFIAVSQMDKVKFGCMSYMRALTTAEVPAELHIYMKGEHGDGMRPYPFRKWGEACARWLEDVDYGGMAEGEGGTTTLFQ